MIIPLFTCHWDLAYSVAANWGHLTWVTIIRIVKDVDISNTGERFKGKRVSQFCKLVKKENKTCQKQFCFNGIRTYDLSNSSEYCTHWAIKLTWRWWHCVTQHMLIGTLRNNNADGGERALRSGEIQKVNCAWLQGDLIKFCIRTQREWSSFCVVWKRGVLLLFPLLCQQRKEERQLLVDVVHYAHWCRFCKLSYHVRISARIAVA